MWQIIAYATLVMICLVMAAVFIAGCGRDLGRQTYIGDLLDYEFDGNGTTTLFTKFYKVKVDGVQPVKLGSKVYLREYEGPAGPEFRLLLMPAHDQVFLVRSMVVKPNG